MYGNANCYADILRSVVTNSDGDEVDAGTDTPPIPVYTHVPFSIIERNRTVDSPSSLMPRVVRVPVGRCAGNLAIQEDDQIVDQTHGGILYTIVDMSRAGSVVAQSEWVFTLQRVTGGARTP